MFDWTVFGVGVGGKGLGYNCLMKNRDVFIQSGGRSLHGVFVAPEGGEGSFPVVLFIHGMTSSNAGYVEIVERLASVGIAGLALSLSGHGQSSGDFDGLSVDELVEDGVEAMKYLLDIPGLDSGRIGLMGTSVGAHICSMISREFPIRSMVLRAPAVYSLETGMMLLPDIMESEGTIFADLKDMLASVPTIKAIWEFKGSLLVIASEKDQVIPDFISRAYVDNALEAKEKNYYTIVGAGHGLSEKIWREDFIDMTVGWFGERLG